MENETWKMEKLRLFTGLFHLPSSIFHSGRHVSIGLITMPRVLIVDDDTDVREMLEMFLEHSGYATSLASNGAEALARMREQAPCLVLLDMMMPGMSGWQFRERQLADSTLSKVPVVCITAAHDPQIVTARLGLPCLQKPVDLEQLASVVHRACHQAAG
jgi:CheY-like chemotaxis protein